MNNVTRNKDRIITNISERREESEEKVSGLEKELDAQNNVIIDLKEKLRRNGEVLDEQAEVEKLVKDIEVLKIANEAKEVHVEGISQENEQLKVKLKVLENKAASNLMRNFSWRKCEIKFVSLEMLRNHMKREYGENAAATLHLRLHELEADFIYHMTNNHKEAAVMFFD